MINSESKGELKDNVPHSLLPKSTVASRCVANLKSALQAEASGQVNGPFSLED